jgi:hypothetical protein
LKSLTFEEFEEFDVRKWGKVFVIRRIIRIFAAALRKSKYKF